MGANKRSTNNEWNERIHLNKKAFDAVMNAYLSMRTRRTVGAVDYSSGVGGSANEAKPTPSDFCCDVESAIQAGVKTDKMFGLFIVHYIYGYDKLSLKQQSFVEQLVGQKFRRRAIWPLTGRNGYFTSIRKPRKNDLQSYVKD